MEHPAKKGGFPRFFQFGTVVANVLAHTAHRSAWGRQGARDKRDKAMEKSLFNPKTLLNGAFWSSKLGQAALASIVAMSAMVIITTQTSDASAATFPAPHTGSVMVEIA